jgi:hypothetical protein
MAGAEAGLLGLPDLAHATVAGYCGQGGHAMLMSTSSAALGTFGALLTEIRTRRYRGFIGGKEAPPILAFSRLLRRLPNLRRLEWRSRPLDGLLEAITAGAGCQGIVELVLREAASLGGEGATAFGAALGTGNLPSLQRLRVYSEAPEVLTDIAGGLSGGASPRLTDLQSTYHYEDMPAFAEALEARAALGCRPLTRLSLRLESAEGDPRRLTRVFSSRALAELESLVLHDVMHDDEVGAAPCMSHTAACMRCRMHAALSAHGGCRTCVCAGGGAG